MQTIIRMLRKRPKLHDGRGGNKNHFIYRRIGNRKYDLFSAKKGPLLNIAITKENCNFTELGKFCLAY
jgi:hypothetical protein